MKLPENSQTPGIASVWYRGNELNEKPHGLTKLSKGT